MAKTWVLVAHDAGARIFENLGPGQGLDLVQELEHPEGRERNREIDTDRPGRRFRRDSGDPRRASMSREESAHERVVSDFARQVAGKLEQGRNSNEYDQLVLVAAPRFLGLLRNSLDDVTAKLVVGSLDKDLAHCKEAEIGEHLADVIRV